MGYGLWLLATLERKARSGCSSSLATSSPGPSAWEAPERRVIRRATRRALGTRLPAWETLHLKDGVSKQCITLINLCPPKNLHQLVTVKDGRNQRRMLTKDKKLHHINYSRLTQYVYMTEYYYITIKIHHKSNKY